MALFSGAGNVVFTYQNNDRDNATPPIVFPDFSSTTEFSFAFWVKANDRLIPSPIIAYTGTNGSQFYFYWDGTDWILEIRVGATVVLSHRFSGLQTASGLTSIWRPFCITKDLAGNVKIYGRGATGSPTDPDNPVQMVLQFTFPTDPFGLSFSFSQFLVVAAPHVSICGIKVWNAAITDTTEMTNQMNSWEADGTPQPIWACPFRTYDVANIDLAHRKTSPYWSQEHSWNGIGNIENLLFDSHDPEYMAKHQETPTWLYPVGYPTPPTVITYDLDLTPTVPTTYKSDQFFRVTDVGTVPPDGTLAGPGFLYFGYPTNDGTGVAQSSSWALFKDENGNELSNPVVAQNRFEDDTSVIVPASLTCANLYQWSFGAQFTWQTQPSPVAAATAMLTNVYLMVFYIGYPTGEGHLPFDDLIGLFAIKKGGTVDSYYRGTELKIPDPTIRTAFIGE